MYTLCSSKCFRVRRVRVILSVFISISFLVVVKHPRCSFSQILLSPNCWRSRLSASIHQREQVSGKTLRGRSLSGMFGWLVEQAPNTGYEPNPSNFFSDTPRPISPTATKLSSARTTLPWFPSLIQKVCPLKSIQKQQNSSKQDSLIARISKPLETDGRSCVGKREIHTRTFVHSLKDRESYKNLERKVDSAVLGETMVHRHMCVDEAQVEGRNWGKGNSDYFSGDQSRIWISAISVAPNKSVGVLGSERQDQFVWIIWIAEKGLPRKLCKDYQDVEESRSCYCDLFLIMRNMGDLMICLSQQEKNLKTVSRWMVQIRELTRRVNSLSDAREFFAHESGSSSVATHARSRSNFYFCKSKNFAARYWIAVWCREWCGYLLQENFFWTILSTGFNLWVPLWRLWHLRQTPRIFSTWCTVSHANLILV